MTSQTVVLIGDSAFGSKRRTPAATVAATATTALIRVFICRSRGALVDFRPQFAFQIVGHQFERECSSTGMRLESSPGHVGTRWYDSPSQGDHPIFRRDRQSCRLAKSVLPSPHDFRLLTWITHRPRSLDLAILFFGEADSVADGPFKSQ